MSTQIIQTNFSEGKGPAVQSGAFGANFLAGKAQALQGKAFGIKGTMKGSDFHALLDELKAARLAKA